MANQVTITLLEKIDINLGYNVALDLKACYEAGKDMIIIFSNIVFHKRISDNVKKYNTTVFIPVICTHLCLFNALICISDKIL
jgi:hypothetical protein